MNPFRKAIVVSALVFLMVGILLRFSILQSRCEEIVLDEWDPLTPSTLYPGNVTGWAFMVLTQDGTFLELNISASGDVRVRIGAPTFNEVTGELEWKNLIFDHVGTRFTQRVAIAGTEADFLEIKNEGAVPVNISGNIKKIGNTYRTYYPHASLGALTVLVGLSLLLYGVFAKPGKKRKRRH
jgi:hypothetical protein